MRDIGPVASGAKFLLIVVGSACALSACSIASRPPSLMVEVIPQTNVAVSPVDAATATRQYKFISWLSFPAVGPWTYDVGAQFTEYLSSLERQVFPPEADAPLQLSVTLTAFDVSSFYQAACSVRAQLVEKRTGAVLLDKQYVEVGRSSFLRIFWFRWFFGVGTRSGLPATTATAFDRVFARVAADVVSSRNKPGGR